MSILKVHNHGEVGLWTNKKSKSKWKFKVTQLNERRTSDLVFVVVMFCFKQMSLAKKQGAEKCGGVLVDYLLAVSATFNPCDMLLPYSVSRQFAFGAVDPWCWCKTLLHRKTHQLSGCADWNRVYSIQPRSKASYDAGNQQQPKEENRWTSIKISTLWELLP